MTTPEHPTTAPPSAGAPVAPSGPAAAPPPPLAEAAADRASPLGANSPPSQDAALRMLASPRHTFVLIGIIALITALGALGAHRLPPTPTRSHVGQYVVLLAAEWMLFLYTWRGLRKAGTPFSTVIGERWQGLGGALRSAAWAGGFWIAAVAILGLVKRGFDAADPARVAEAKRTMALMTPHGGVEIALWAALAVSAGVCEEFVFRGYLQRQFGALTRSVPLGIALSALVFGIGHGYQGIRSVVVITLYGLLFGLLAHHTRSLKPGMIAHAWQDLFSGLAGRA